MELVSTVTDEQAKQIMEQPMDKGLFMPYLILLSGNDENGDVITEWKKVVGRQEAYDYIKLNIDWIDLVESQIVSQDNTIKEALSTLEYMQHVLESGKIEDPGFDPMDYVVGDNEDEEDEE